MKGNGVTRKELYDELTATRQEINDQYRAIAEFMGRCDEKGTALEKRIDVHRDALDTLEAKVDAANSRDKWWNGLNTLAVAVATGLGILDFRR